MSTDFSPPQRSVSPARTRRLASSKPTGKTYKRWADVEAEIQRVLGLHESEWLVEAPDLQSETLVFLIRHVRRGNEELYRRLLQELTSRIPRIAGRWALGFDEYTTEDILMKVEIEILTLVLTEKPTKQSDFLEMAFGKAVERRTNNAVRNHKRSVQGHRGQIIAQPEEDAEAGEIERPIELAADHRPGPQAIFLQDQAETERAKSVKKAYGAVKDPLDREVVRLHIEEGLPIHSSDPNKDTIVRRLGETARRVKYRFSRGMKAMRKALGV